MNEDPLTNYFNYKLQITLIKTLTFYAFFWQKYSFMNDKKNNSP